MFQRFRTWCILGGNFIPQKLPPYPSQSEPSHVCCSVSWSFLIAMGTWPRSHTQYQPQWKRSANPLLDMYTRFSNRPAIFWCRKMAGWKLPPKIVCPGLQSLQLMKILTTAMQALRQAQKMHFLAIYTHPGSKIHTLTKIMRSTKLVFVLNTPKKNGRKNMIENKKLSGQRVPIGTLTKGSMANCSHTKPHKLGRCLMNRSKLPKKRFKQNKNTRNQSNQSTDFSINR